MDGRRMRARGRRFEGAMERVTGERELRELRQERDLYLRLLELGEREAFEPFLEEALSLIVDLTGAERGYIEVRDPEDSAHPTCWSIAKACSRAEVQNIRDLISQGIIAETLAVGEAITTASALLDPRFAARESVKAKRIEAVLCAPIGSDPPLGVVYLQGRRDPQPFSRDDRERAELFGRRIAPLADRLLARSRADRRSDETLELRRTLEMRGVIGRSRALAAVMRQVAQVAPLEVSVLLTGESGTGKTQLAQVIHANGPRATGPLVELNCPAIPESLFENELFGHVAGAYSDASSAARGKVAAAEHGTLFLDEIGAMPLPVQAKLLQLLQSKRYYPLGGTTPIDPDIRVIAATNVDLEQAVAEKSFREDLFYRLQVLPIRLPSLRERREDVTELARHFVSDACKRHGFGEMKISRRALLAAEATEWPGNVRQLSHAIEAAVIRAAAEGIGSVEQRHLFPEEAAEHADDERVTLGEATRRFQRDFIRQTLDEAQWNVTEAAERLDIARSHLYNLIKTHELRRQPFSS